jgi:hypothetical protein
MLVSYMNRGVFNVKADKTAALPTLDSGINIGLRLLIFEKIWRKKKLNDRNAYIDVKKY